jgi:long-chain acyl-CoA synthetase
MSYRQSEPEEWQYPLPPTPYDTVRDSWLMKSTRLMAHGVMRNILRTYNNLEVIGAENVLFNWPCIITPNHSSHLDTIAVFAALPVTYVNRVCVLAAKDYFFKNSLISFGARLTANVIPIDRLSTEQRALFICLAKQREGKSILIFPEGTRAIDNHIGKFKEGSILLSRKTLSAIIPTFIRGTYESMPKSRRFPRPKKITIIFGEAVHYWDKQYLNLDNRQAALDLEQRVKTLTRKV